MRGDLCDEAIRLGKLLAVLMPDEAEVLGLLALMLLQDSRRAARTDAAGDLVLLEDQDRSLWNRDRIAEGLRVLDRALSMHNPGPYQLQAAIAALHAQAATPEETDWAQIAALYAELERSTASPVVALNRAVAVAMTEGYERGLALMDDLPLDEYHLFHAARADLLRRLERHGRPRPRIAGHWSSPTASRSVRFCRDGWRRSRLRLIAMERDQLRRVLLIATIAALSLTALIAIGALVAADFGETELRILATTAGFGFTTLTRIELGTG